MRTGDPVPRHVVDLVDLAVVREIDLRVRGVAHFDAEAVNSSHGPETRSSFSTRSVGWAPRESHLIALAESMLTTDGSDLGA